MIRPAVASDLPALSELAQDFEDEGLGGPELDVDAYSVMANLIQAMPRDDWCVFVSTDYRDVPVGLLVGTLMPSVYNLGQVIAHERAWYVQREYRRTTAAIRLLRRFERWALEHNAAAILVAHEEDVEPERVAAIYRKSGYRRYESFWVKGVKECQPE
ncbi:MAG: N-acetyltransferase family protein [Planctomycetota bacterium]